jgi:hypothetical protein
MITVALDRLLAAMGRRANKPLATGAVWLVTAAAGVTQLARPELLDQFRRDPAALVALILPMLAVVDTALHDNHGAPYPGGHGAGADHVATAPGRTRPGLNQVGTSTAKR